MEEKPTDNAYYHSALGCIFGSLCAEDQCPQLSAANPAPSSSLALALIQSLASSHRGVLSLPDLMYRYSRILGKANAASEANLAARRDLSRLAPLAVWARKMPSSDLETAVRAEVSLTETDQGIQDAFVTYCYCLVALIQTPGDMKQAFTKTKGFVASKGFHKVLDCIQTAEKTKPCFIKKHDGVMEALVSALRLMKDGDCSYEEAVKSGSGALAAIVGAAVGFYGIPEKLRPRISCECQHLVCQLYSAESLQLTIIPLDFAKRFLLEAFRFLPRQGASTTSRFDCIHCPRHDLEFWAGRWLCTSCLTAEAEDTRKRTAALKAEIAALEQERLAQVKAIENDKQSATAQLQATQNRLLREIDELTKKKQKLKEEQEQEHRQHEHYQQQLSASAALLPLESPDFEEIKLRGGSCSSMNTDATLPSPRRDASPYTMEAAKKEITLSLFSDQLDSVRTYVTPTKEPGKYLWSRTLFIFALNCSAEMRGPRWEGAKSGYRRCLNVLAKMDRVMITAFSFDTKVNPHINCKTPGEALIQSPKLPFTGRKGTDFAAALRLAVSCAEKRDEKCKDYVVNILLLSGGEGSAYPTEEINQLLKMKKNGMKMLFYTMACALTEDQNLIRMAKETGGEHYRVNEPGTAEAVFLRVLGAQ